MRYYSVALLLRWSGKLPSLIQDLDLVQHKLLVSYFDMIREGGHPITHEGNKLG
uniref:Uncharacterized protein n=1 Tax=Candidatus Kentrum sp. DK TaxID=2126562 RepID=A0A450ST95_9GAMM|nr:MAG: hypothetical protein BECKDK2373B_GA0170837_106325 [Candidatus Kentron sp. DK]